MKELDIDSIMSAMEKPAVGDNLKRVMDVLNQADTFLKQVETIMTRMDRMGLKPLVVRGLGKQLGVDAETPLKTDNNFKSSTHQRVYEAFNQMSEEDLIKQLGSAANVKGEEA